MPDEREPSELRRIGRSEILVLPPPAFSTLAAELLAETLDELSGQRPNGEISLALSGGSTPGPVYERLARSDRVDWGRIRIFFADERAVSPDDEASNYDLVRRTLLDLLPEAPSGVLRMEADEPDLDEAAARYARSLPEKLDLLILGIGGDGHTASLFPGSPNLEEATRRVAVARSPTPPTLRLTITPVVIHAARNVYVLARGAEKAGPVAEALLERATVSTCPARLATGGVWILDEEAAGLLGP